jgi:aconitate hydratase
MMRGTFANTRLRNILAGGAEGPVTRYLPSDELLPVADAASRYGSDGTPLIILAGREYGSGSSRDWAAKGTRMLGVRAVIAQSYERIHRSNLIGMGVLPLQFLPGESTASLGLTGEEAFTITGLSTLTPRSKISVDAVHPASNARTTFTVLVRLDGPIEGETYRHGGIMPAVLRRLAASGN